MYPSSIPRRKKVERELFETLYSVGPGEFICKLLKSQGNYLFTAEDERGEQLLLSIPDRLRNAFYFSSGDYVLCAPLEHKKVRGEIRTVLYEKQITHLIGLNSWKTVGRLFAITCAARILRSTKRLAHGNLSALLVFVLLRVVLVISQSPNDVVRVLSVIMTSPVTQTRYFV
ncbi:hypothetical protein CRM22_007530 [Opisthorchis felineus]|uniref:S1-like domain-containing protein n=1 Tax=Opisthorchis felineus TaxID=147828 RepID=A0A4V3SDW7_OPIFE|nr:hypothetical protein CRM22_007530 [Opisthorchis felineus]